MTAKARTLVGKHPKIGVYLGALKCPHPCFCCHRVSLSTFSYVLYPRPERATFFDEWSSVRPSNLTPSQTKIGEGGTKDEMRMFETLFKGERTQIVPLTMEKSVENPDFIFCSSFPNLRLGAHSLLGMRDKI